jgi:hypothetical protein
VSPGNYLSARSFWKKEANGCGKHLWQNSGAFISERHGLEGQCSQNFRLPSRRLSFQGLVGNKIGPTRPQYEIQAGGWPAQAKGDARPDWQLDTISACWK